MAKEKTEKKVKKEVKPKIDRQYEVLAKEVKKIFDREPNGSVLGAQARAFIKKLNDA